MVFKTVASSSKTIVDLTDAYTVSLSNESVSIACDVAGTAIAGELGAAGKATAVLSVYKGSIALTAVGSGVTPAVGQYKYIIGTTTGSTVTRSNDSTFYIATITADSGSIPVTIYLEGNTTTITKTMTWNKSKTGATGKAVVSIAEEYYSSTSPSSQTGSSWGTAVPAWVNGEYLWTRTRTVFSSGADGLTNPICVSGQKGTDGTIYYQWVKYADDASGLNISDSPAGKRFMGIAVGKTSATESTTPGDYSWSPLYDNVVVGGTNLWLNSSPEKSYAYWTATDGTKSLDASILWAGKPTIKFIKASVAVGGLSNNVPRSLLPAATQYTYSFMVNSSVSMPVNSSSLGHMQVLGTSDGGANVHRETAITYNPSTIPANKWTKVSITFSTPAEAVAGETFTFRSYLYYLTYAATYYFSDFQLEKGNVATDWTPAPEDVSIQIESKSKTFTATPTVPYNAGDIWQSAAMTYISTVTRLTGSYTAGDWIKTGDVTLLNTANDVTYVGGTAAATIVTGAANGTTANTAYNDIASDTKFTAVEKQSARAEWDGIALEKPILYARGNTLGLTEATTYQNAFIALGTYLNNAVAYTTGVPTWINDASIGTTTTIVGSAYRSAFSTYYQAHQSLSTAIATKEAANAQTVSLAAAAKASALAQAMTQGKMLYKDPAFALDVNGTSVYRTGTWTRVVSTTDSVLPPTTSGWMMKLNVTGAPGTGGGFTFGTMSRPNAKFIVNFTAYAPIGTTINFATNEIGTGATTAWLTGNVGTGKWEEYTYSVTCGPTTATAFSSTNFFYFENATYPFNAYVSKATVYDTTAHEGFASQINNEPGTVLIEGSKLHFTTAVSMDSTWIDQLVANSIVTAKIQATDIVAGRITSGTISADRIAAGSLSGDKITANTIDATRLKIGSGAQGGYINNPRFSAWASTYPDGTSLWSAGGISKVTVDTVPMAQFAPALGAQQGMTLNASYFANGIDLDAMQYFALECRFRLTSGTNPAGACFLVDINRRDSTSERMQLNMVEAGTTLTTNTWYVARKVFKLADANVAKTFKDVAGFLLANWSGSGDAAKTIQFASVNMFQASAQEYLTQSWTGAGTTSINGGMIATGSLDAAKITTGIINAGTGVSTINMNTGDFSFGNGKIALSGSTLSINVDSLKITSNNVATELYANTQVANVEVGGRNTFKKATDVSNLSGATTRTANTLNGTTVVTTTAASSIRVNNVITMNGNWTFSAWVTSTVAGTLTIDFADNSSQTFPISTTRTKIVRTGVVANYSVGTYHFIDISGLPISTVTFEDLQVERGTKATDWTAAPEDVDAKIEVKADNQDVSSRLNTAATAASTAQATADSKLTASVYDDFLLEYADYKNSQAQQSSAASASLEAARASVSAVTTELGSMKETWTFDNGTKIDATGSGMLLTDESGGMELLLSNNRISFFDSGVEVAYIADKTLKINHGIFVKSAQIGSHLISTSPSNPDITIVTWVG